MPTTKRVLTLGTFDIPHLGHANFIRKCAEYGDLTIGVNSDRFVMKYKKERPVYNQDERMKLMSVLGHRVILNDGPGFDTIQVEMPDIIAVGSDWLSRNYLRQIRVTREWLERNEVAIIFVPYTREVSTSDIKEHLAR